MKKNTMSYILLVVWDFRYLVRVTYIFGKVHINSMAPFLLGNKVTQVVIKPCKHNRVIKKWAKEWKRTKRLFNNIYASILHYNVITGGLPWAWIFISGESLVMCWCMLHGKCILPCSIHKHIKQFCQTNKPQQELLLWFICLANLFDVELVWSFSKSNVYDTCADIKSEYIHTATCF